MSNTLDDALQILENSNLFITGGAGVGKSYLLKELITAYRKLDKNVAVLASTGIAAVAIEGVTVHSFFKLGIAKILPQLLEQKLYFAQKKQLREIISALDVVVIDEISMISAGVLEMIEFRLNSFGFSGKVIVSGDFLQLPPVRKADEEERLSLQYNIKEEERERYFGYAFKSPSWQRFGFYKLELLTNKRTNESEFVEFLQNIRYGSCDINIKDFLLSLTTNKLTKEVANSSTLLYATNQKVNSFNHARLAENPNTPFEIPLEISKSNKDIQKQLESYISNLPVEQLLTIKANTPILFSANTSEFKNGQRGVIKEISKNQEKFKIIVELDGNFIELKKNSYELKKYEIQKEKDKIKVEEEVIATTKQFPIKLAYALTIHKSQGMSIENLAISLDEIFEKSQFYVALSRATTTKNLTLLSKKPKNMIESWFKKMISIDEDVVKFYLNYKQPIITKNLWNIIK